MNDNEYMNDYMKDRWKQRREEAIDQLGGKCVKCNSTEDLEFDHIDPSTKLFTISSGSSFSETRFQEELKKCQLLCRECHKKKTSRSNSVDHGQGLSGKRNCPCELCKAKKAEYMKAYTAKVYSHQF